MEWHDEGLIIGVRRHGESNVILEVMTQGHGRHLGIVRGGRGQRLRPVLQAGNSASLVWRARLDEHLGAYAVEATRFRAAALMANKATLHGLNLVTSLLHLLAERDPHAALYEAAVLILDRLEDPEIAPALLARFELAVLAELGFGLDFSCCAATGSKEDLVFVSPKSGRAVSRQAGEPYRDRLLPLPAFLLGASSAPSRAEIRDAFALAGFFLTRDVFGPRGAVLPEAHAAYLGALPREIG